MRRVKLEKAQARLGEYIKASLKRPVLIVQDGEPVAMLVGLERKNKPTVVKLRDVLKRAWEDYEKNGGIPHEQFWEDLARETRSSQ